jgi:hypothetical protein
VVTATVTSTTGFANASTQCGGTKVATGGGYSYTGQSPNITYMGPLGGSPGSPPTGWQVTFISSNGSTASNVTVYAVCSS